jgi:ABC-type branched-subunit amino acid transport system ATPase component
VIGGLASITGAFLGALLVIGLPTFFPDSEEVRVLTSGAGLLILLLYFPGGLVQILYNLRDTVIAALARRAAARPPEAPTRSKPVRRALPPPAPADAQIATLLRTSGVSVAFGSREVLQDVSIEVYRDEVVGLIGANGAGKTTLMNAIGGYLPSGGDVLLLERSVRGAPPFKRASLGLGRTFQDAALYGDLTVRETVQVAVETRARARWLPVVLSLPPARRVERAKQAHADEILDYLGLGPYAESFISELSTGTRRIVEFACLLASDAKVLCLDEPTAGVAQREAEAFGPLLLQVRQELNAAMLIIEHDMPLVMSVSDRIYCLEAGRVICSGAPEHVRNDPLVIASYLGTDVAAIERSDPRASSPDAAAARSSAS